MTHEVTQESTDDTRSAPDLGCRPARFVVVFVVLTIGLLTGYHYAEDTRANARYLAVVAKHTAWALDVVGHRAEMSLSWKGPRVDFMYSASASTQLEEARKELAALRGDGAAAAVLEAAETRVKAFEDEHDKVRETQGAAAARNDKRFVFIVVPECGAIEVMVIFLAGVLAFPAGLGARALGLALGMPMLYGVNLLRLTALGVVGAVDGGEQWFEFCHRYVWQTFYIIFVVLAWLAWIEFVVKRRINTAARQAGS